jgi:NTE family protein
VSDPHGPPRLALVLGAGGARGAAHVGVLKRLQAEGIPIDAIVGCSAGAIAGGLYAGAGVEPGELIEAAQALGPSTVLSFALSRWRLPGISARALRRAGPLPAYLRRLEEASFQVLHRGVRRLGILTLSLLEGRTRLIYGGPGLPEPLPLAAAVKASAAIPGLFPPLAARLEGRRRLLADPGWFTAVPVEAAFAPPVGARRVIAVDLSLIVCLRQLRRGYWESLRRTYGDRLLVLRPALQGCGTILPGRGSASRAAAAGEASLGPEALRVIRSWLAPPAPTGKSPGAAFP